MIVFVTLFLGLVSGLQPVVVDVSGPVKSVRLLLDGREVAVIKQAPWRTGVDFGPELAPHELTAVALDAEDKEIARTSQTLNLPRPKGEFEILVSGDAVTLHWRHLLPVQPTRAEMTLDGKPVALDAQFRARLPKIDAARPHVLAAEMRFGDGTVARRELILAGERATSVSTELTPVLVRETSPTHPATWDGCLRTPAGQALRTSAVEKPNALLIMVRDPDRKESQRAVSNWFGMSNRLVVPLDAGTVERVLWPAPRRVASGSDTSVLFDAAGDFSAASAGILYLLLLNSANDTGIRQFADAVAVAGIQTLNPPQRRAVVYLISSYADSSDHRPAVVRRYLQSLGVPLSVWSLNGPRPDLAESWGPVADVSTLPKLEEEVKRLRKTLDDERIAWVDVDPLTALQLKADERCGIAPIATPSALPASAH